MSISANVAAYDLHTRIRTPIILSLLQPVEGESVLDVGSGTGYLSERIAALKGCACCLDISLQNLLSVREGKRSNELFINSTAERLPLKRGCFDKVLCTEVLEHLREDREALREMVRILKPGGIMVITVPCREFRFPSLIEALGVKTVHDYDGPEKHFRKGYTLAELSHALRGAGMEVHNHAYFCHFFSKLLLDVVSIAHLLLRRVWWGQKAWSWAEIQSLNTKRSFALYRLFFPLLVALSKLDALFLHLPRARGSGLAIAARKSS